MSQEHKYTHSEGYTLIEIIISILFFSAITLSIGYTFTGSINLTKNDQEMITANNLARKYFREVEDNWKLQNGYDAGGLPTVDSSYTKNGRYTVTATKTNIATNSDSKAVIRRVKIIYKNQNNKTLVNLSLDYNRPGTQVTE